jgi:hypothetical protein
MSSLPTEPEEICETPHSGQSSQLACQMVTEDSTQL